MANENSNSRGSIWQKWDLHIHAPGTKLSNGFGKPDDNVWNEYLTTLESSSVVAFGITDYFSFDCYFSTLEKYKALFPQGRAFFIPNIEFRLTEVVGKSANVHAHVLFDPAVEKARLSNLLSDVVTHITDKNGNKKRCTELIEGDFDKATVAIGDLTAALKKFRREEYILILAAGSDGLRTVDTSSERSKSISDELDRASDGFFGKANNTKFFLSNSRYESGAPSLPKPVFDGSDAHSINELTRLTGDEPNYGSTWIKAELSFRGLRQTLFEPEHRVFVGDRPDVLVRLEREATRFIDKLSIDSVNGYSGGNGTWFQGVSMDFNPELTAIIGNKGSGKSAIADILALLGDTRRADHFSFLVNTSDNRKFLRPGYAEKFHGTLHWADGNKSKKQLDKSSDLSRPEAIRYLPQNYFENLTNEIEVQEFRAEIENVVFSHIELMDRIGTATFAELQEKKTSNSKRDASSLKVKLRELNLKIVDLEEQAAPKFKARLEAELHKRKAEIKALQLSKPKVVQAPAVETAEQKAITDQIASILKTVGLIEDKGKRLSEEVTRLTTKIQSLTLLNEELTSLSASTESEKTRFKQTYAELGLDFEDLIKIEVSSKPVLSLIKTLNDRKSEIQQDSKLIHDENIVVDVLQTLPDLRSAHIFLSRKVATLRETLTAPQQRYQKYIQAEKEIQSKIDAIAGEHGDSKAGTVVDLEAQISRIDNNLAIELKGVYAERDKLVSQLYDTKKHIKTFYEGLKGKVESKLGEVSENDFSVSIDASFVISPDFSKEFLGYINQNVAGPFRGVTEGQKALQLKLANVEWNSLESIKVFIEDLLDRIKEDGEIEKQLKDVKKFYDFLYSLEYFDAKYELRLGGKDLNQLSPGEKGLLLLVFYLHLDMEKIPLLIDQPEDNLDNDSIFAVLAKCIRQAKKSRQVILVTHNPNLAVGADAEQIIYVKLDKSKNYKFSYEYGAIENPRINELVVEVLEGTRPAFVQRRLVYQIN